MQNQQNQSFFEQEIKTLFQQIKKIIAKEKLEHNQISKIQSKFGKKEVFFNPPSLPLRKGMDVEPYLQVLNDFKKEEEEKLLQLQKERDSLENEYQNILYDQDLTKSRGELTLFFEELEKERIKWGKKIQEKNISLFLPKIPAFPTQKKGQSSQNFIQEIKDFSTSKAILEYQSTFLQMQKEFQKKQEAQEEKKWEEKTQMVISSLKKKYEQINIIREEIIQKEEKNSFSFHVTEITPIPEKENLSFEEYHEKLKEYEINLDKTSDYLKNSEKDLQIAIKMKAWKEEKEKEMQEALQEKLEQEKTLLLQKEELYKKKMQEYKDSLLHLETKKQEESSFLQNTLEEEIKELQQKKEVYETSLLSLKEKEEKEKLQHIKLQKTFQNTLEEEKKSLQEKKEHYEQKAKNYEISLLEIQKREKEVLNKEKELSEKLQEEQIKKTDLFPTNAQLYSSHSFFEKKILSLFELYPQMEWELQHTFSEPFLAEEIRETRRNLISSSQKNEEDLSNVHILLHYITFAFHSLFTATFDVFFPAFFKKEKEGAVYEYIPLLLKKSLLNNSIQAKTTETFFLKKWKTICLFSDIDLTGAFYPSFLKGNTFGKRKVLTEDHFLAFLNENIFWIQNISFLTQKDIFLEEKYLFLLRLVFAPITDAKGEKDKGEIIFSHQKDVISLSFTPQEIQLKKGETLLCSSSSLHQIGEFLGNFEW